MKTFATIALFGGMAAAKTMSQSDYDYMRYVSEHNKHYDSVEEFEMRKALFIAVETFIRRANQTSSTYRAGHNKFSDWTQEEKDKLLGLKNVQLPEVFEVADEVDTANLPESVDWREEGKVSPVKDQGNCGSCWAFSTIEAVESALAIATDSDPLIQSPQELVDCTLDPVTYNDGCNGGWYFWSYDWLKDHYTMLESDYPYTSGSTGNETSCMYDEDLGVTEVSSYGQTKGADANLARLAQQPVNVAVAAGNNVFMNYQSGIITSRDHCPTRIDHAIVAVGYGVEDGVQYYIVRNSWGTSWGEDGYVRIATDGGKKGVCGIDQYVYYPTI